MKSQIKVFILIITLGLAMSEVQAQNTLGKIDDLGRITLNTYVSQQIEALPSSAMGLLSNKMSQIASKNGMGGSNPASRFIITPNISVLTKDLTSTAPPMTALSLGLTVYIGDGIDNKIFAFTSIELKGVGTNETKAYISALKTIKPDHPQFQQLVEDGKNRIIEYYNTQCDFIIKEAEMLTGKNEYNAAMYKLASVPLVCKECYETCMDKITEVYAAKLEHECQTNIARANAAMAANNWEEAASYLALYTPGLDCYPKVQQILKQIADHQCAVALGKAQGAWSKRNSEEAGDYLSQIPTDSKCAPEARELFNAISSKLDADEQRDWDLEYEKWNRNQILIEKYDYELKKQQIEAAREVGVAYGKNQPNTVYKVTGWW